jgi:membrane glycosyltransferase
VVAGGSGWTPLKVGQMALFGLLFTSLSFGFTQAFLGFLMLAEGREPLKITNTLDQKIPLAPTAVVMPVYNEDTEIVFGNIRAVYDSLRERGDLEHFDFYILSDSTDPAKAVEEGMAWADLCRQTNSFGQLHYRRRKLPVNRKSGNIADFCRRWGHRYRYMVVLDADSVMTGSAVSSLVRLMEANPKAGIIQTMPRLVKAETVFGRIQQFAARLYSPIFAAGLNFWQQGVGNYWGHNAIIRVTPFLASCGLPVLPGSAPIGGKILSHDFVEAALMLDAGWEVWFAYDLEGSYEELPPNLTEYVKRDRRWCQGNLQHMWFLLADNIQSISRVHLVQGILAYGSAPLLVLFVLMGGMQAGISRFHEPVGNFPSSSALVLLGLTAWLLFGPKILSVMYLFSRPRAEIAIYGGRAKVLAAVVLETLFSVLTTPVLVWFHTLFVLKNLDGKVALWNTQTRGGAAPRWRDIAREYWPLPVVGLGLAMVAWLISPTYLAWVSPLLIGLFLAIPVAKLSGEHYLFRSLFLTPEELSPPKELTVRFKSQLRAGDQFIHAILDPFYNAIHVSLQRGRAADSLDEDDYALGLSVRLFEGGPGVLSPRERRALLSDGAALAFLHTLIWQTPAKGLHPDWVQALLEYRARS